MTLFEKGQEQAFGASKTFFSRKGPKMVLKKVSFVLGNDEVSQWVSNSGTWLSTCHLAFLTFDQPTA